MGLPVTVYRSTDPGAPVIRPTKPSDWITILKKVLVDGYGSKAPLGWQLAFEDVAGLAVAFRQDPTKGSGGYVKFWSVGADAVGTNLRVDCARSMTDINNLIMPLGYRQLYVSPNNSNLQGASGWTIVGCAKGFWVTQENDSTVVANGNTNAATVQWHIFAGDLDVFDPNDAGLFTLVAGAGSGNNTTGDTTTTSWQANVGGLSVGCSMYAADGGASKTYYSAGYGSAVTDANGDLSTIGIPVPLFPVTPSNGAVTQTISAPQRRGNVPGLFSTYLSSRNQSVPVIKNFGGRDYMAVKGYYSPVLWIQISGEWYE